jgi:LuxR family maltose regulon positive regulatory protein
MLGNILAQGGRKMARNVPRISEQWVYDPALLEGCVQLDTPAWFAWLASETTTRFSYGLYDRQMGYIVGWITVRKEQRQRGGHYWVAYRRLGGPVRKVYIGSSGAVTAQRLQTIAEQLQGKEVASSEQVGQ